MSFVTYCGYCGGEPLTVGHNHRAGCPTSLSNSNNPPVLTNTMVATPVIPLSARHAIERLRRKLKCIVSEYRMVGTLTEEDLQAAEQVLDETAGSV